MSTTQNAKLKTQNNSVKRKTACFKLLVVVLSFALYAFSFNKTDASDLSLGIYPPIIQIRLEPPARISTPIAIENRGDETVSLQILFKPFTSNEARHRTVPGEGESGEVSYLWEKEVYSESPKNPLIFQNIKISEPRTNLVRGENGKAVDETTLAPKQKKSLSLNIDTPKGEKESDYYFSILFISKNVLKADLSYSQIVGGIATNVLLSIGKERPIGKILEFSSPFFLNEGSVPFRLRLENQGKHFITAQGVILVKNMFGQTVGQVELVPVNILALTSRFQETIWQKGVVFGAYTATLRINLSENGPTLVKTINFLVFPLKPIIGLAIIVFIFALLQKRLKTYRRQLK